MGSCASMRKFSRPVGLPGPSDLEYQRCASLSIRYKERGRVMKEKVVFTMTEPLAVSSVAIPFFGCQFWASLCILPGLDPRGQINKQCQDLCFIESLPSSILMGVYDGHGKEGQSVVACCRNFALEFYRHQQQLMRANPERFLHDLAVGSDAYLRQEDLGVNVTYSGTTLVLILVTETAVTLASVGDSRAILATSVEPEVVTQKQPPRGEDKDLMERVKRRRSVSVEKPLIAVQLTQDHKPEDPEELKRITSMGGIVRRLMDATGKNVGPWRVWQKDTNHPGLAMSRSIGDLVGHEIGVVCTPSVVSHKRREDFDYFFIAGSDGLWDVMENQEVVDYAEAYRQSAVRGTKSAMSEEHCKPQNACIAQLICEEARARWLSVVEEEDVLIDDISCVILELKDSEVQYILPPDRTSVPNLDGEDVAGVEYSSIPMSEVRLRDPRRNSMNDDEV